MIASGQAAKAGVPPPHGGRVGGRGRGLSLLFQALGRFCGGFGCGHVLQGVDYGFGIVAHAHESGAVGKLFGAVLAHVPLREPVLFLARLAVFAAVHFARHAHHSRIADTQNVPPALADLLHHALHRAHVPAAVALVHSGGHCNPLTCSPDAVRSRLNGQAMANILPNIGRPA